MEITMTDSGLRRDLFYYEGNRIHSTETRQP
jgi:hypothetical protein